MNHDSRRITLINQPQFGNVAKRQWNAARDSDSRIVFVPSFTVLTHAIDNAVHTLGRDVARVIIDRSSTAAEYLELLATLPQEFGGDAMYIRADGSAFLSSMGRGGDRVLYLLTATDVSFYLEMYGLLQAEIRKSA